MSSTTDLLAPGGFHDDRLHNILEEPEQEALLRMTRLVEQIFRVPVAYMALLGPNLEMATRIGSGGEHWAFLKKIYPLGVVLEKPFLWQGPAKGDEIRGEIRFTASAPLRASDGLEIGALVIADVKPRPDFSPRDHEILADLARVLAGKLELRALACQARETELGLKEAEHRFRNIANAAPALIIYSCADGSVPFVNKTWLEFTGRDFEDEIGDGFAERFHPDYRQRVMERYWDAFQARVAHTQEFPMLRRDGEYRWMLARGVPRYQRDGSFAGYIGCFVDITDQRAALLDLQKQTACTAAVAEAAGVCYLILDRQGRIEQVGPRCRQWLPGAAQEEVLGRFLWDVCNAADSDVIRDAVLRAAAEGQTCGTPEGRWKFTPIQSETGDFLAIAATLIGEKGPGGGCR